jgi:hypothetical protein
MKVTKYACSFFLASSIVVTGCGGGGGGGGESDGGSQANAQRGVRVLHGAIEAAPVRVVATATSAGSQGKLLGETFFGEVKGYAAIDKTPLTINAALRSGSEPTVGRFQVTPEEKSRYSLIISNLPGDEETRVTLVDDSVPALGDGQGAVRLAHAVGRAETVTATLSGASGEFKLRAGFGQASAYEVIPQGTYQAVVRRAVDGLVLGATAVTIDAKKSGTIFTGGEIGALVFTKAITD